MRLFESFLKKDEDSKDKPDNSDKSKEDKGKNPFEKKDDKNTSSPEKKDEDESKEDNKDTDVDTSPVKGKKTMTGEKKDEIVVDPLTNPAFNEGLRLFESF